jgi:hypothetical protein
VRIVFTHIAGQPSKGIQECSRCGFLLIDSSETRRTYFRVGVYVASDGRQFVEQDSDATGVQIRCEALPVRTDERRWRT